jgi:glycosyltransferase involved in cell wall biosynthesis
MHLIGLGLKRTTGMPWVGDFRDPWTDIDYYGQLRLTGRADRKHRRLEREVLEEADRVVTVSWRWADDLAKLGDRPVDVVTNGFDPDDLPVDHVPVDEQWSLVHVGAMSPTRDVPGLWTRLAAMCQRDPEFRQRFRLRFVGPVDRGVLASVETAGLGAHVEKLGRVSHADAMREMRRARVLLLPVNDTPNSMGILPGKVFEYLSVQRPILAVGPAQGDIARVLGSVHLRVDRDVPEAMTGAVRALFDRTTPVVSADQDRYDRRHLAGDMARLLNELVAPSPAGA